MTTFTTEDRESAEPIPFAGMVKIHPNTWKTEVAMDVLYHPERYFIQGSDEWKQVRLGHITASCVADVMAKGKGGAEAITRKKYKMRLLAERLTGQGQESFTSSAMEWGVTQEPFARQQYEVSHETFVDKTGFWKHPSINWVGVSPDGLVGDKGLIEIKCPNSTTHLDYLLADQVPTEYYKQMQMQLWVTNREWCDFVSYDPRMPDKKRLFIKRLYRSNDFISDMEVEVKQFLSEIEELIQNLNGAENE